MSTVLSTTEALPDLILGAPFSGRRKLVALAGPPASGKSTLAAKVAQDLTDRGTPAAVVPMDGFHLDNGILYEMNLVHRKGSPDSFDAAGLLRLLDALRSDDVVYFPVFDREADRSIAGAGRISAGCEIVIVEGNYLLLNAPIWRDIAKSWDYSIRLDVPVEVLEARLRERWHFYKVPEEEAETKINANDLPNARRVVEDTLAADVIVNG
jgi:pantothenate kinase